MRLLALAFILLIFIIILIMAAVSQIQMAGIKVKDFWSFINANENLDNLYKFAKRYEKMSPQEQIIYLSEAKKMFDAFDKIPETVWEEDRDKYSKVLDTYQNIRVMRWNEEREYENGKNREAEIRKIKPENYNKSQKQSKNKNYKKNN